ncbi:MerR family DNA-binding transcriptional regulator, partial [Blastomonas sp. AAP25]|uniref:MerR family DNA-binding transcriptional regulator n=2 Tax=Pseudomonadota TaxID=1224 RepID=UPI000B31F077
GVAMKIGELASATATKVETVRFYEKTGLLPPPARTSNNYRTYPNEKRGRSICINASAYG